jgi:hypothetical protein
MRRLYDERKPLEPVYSTVPISKTCSAYTESETSDIERLIHAPPGYGYRYHKEIILMEVSVALVMLV